jgi:hypothetical protein
MRQSGESVQECKTKHALEGSTQRGSNRMRINVQLIDTENGNHLWAERFDKPVGSRAKVPSSSAPVIRLKPTTSAAKIAASFLVSTMAPRYGGCRIAQCGPFGAAQIRRRRQARPYSGSRQSKTGDRRA